MAKIIILGDFYPKNVNTLPEIPENDFCVVNLECVITSCNSPIKKDGPSLKIDVNESQFLNKLGINLAGMANNHILDYGVEGLNETISILDSFNIAHAGIKPGSNYYFKEIEKTNICFYFVSEHQYNVLEADNVGVNVLDKQETLQEICDLKKKCDYLVVCFHGGKEHYIYPTPNQQLYCHQFVDCGADLVICQHSHCVGSKETYKTAEIIYGQGNFVFPYSETEHFKSGLIIELKVNKKQKPKIDFIPVVHKEPDIVRIANNDEAKTILEDFDRASSDLAQKTADALYDNLVSEYGLDFLYRLFNKGRLYIRLDTSRYFKNRMLKRYIKKNQKYLLYLYNYFNCETHIEYIKAILSKQIKRE